MVLSTRAGSLVAALSELLFPLTSHHITVLLAVLKYLTSSERSVRADMQKRSVDVTETNDAIVQACHSLYVV